MLSHLRFHRRGPSNPPSPLREQAPAWDAAAQREQPQQSARDDVSPRPDARPRSPNSSRLPPTLPPIARVASDASDHLFTPHDGNPPPSSQDARQPQPRPGHGEEHGAGFLGGVALQNYRRASREPQRPDTGTTMSSPLPENQLSRAKPPPPPINTGFATQPAIPASKQAKSSWFSTPTDLQGPGGASKRPAGPRLASEPTPGPPSEPHKGRKGLPFLKNPMSSLLMRRKTAQTVMEAQPPAPSYDPRIKGTRVHDFSAPRPKKPMSIADTAATGRPETTPTTGGLTDRTDVSASQLLGDAAESSQDAVAAAKLGANGDMQLAQQGRSPSASTHLSDQSRRLVLSDNEPATSLHTSSSAASRDTQGTTLPPAASASVRTTASRQLSKSAMSRGNSVASAIPKHMKSTSSRFSFDMIGAAEQEKLLEERHRQREQEKKTSDDPADTDARFDDFDDDFDYDAMMDDDGLEERIPGVNADYEYEEDLEADFDPDNDQENFAGFVFQRSNPASSLVSPHTPGMLATPRDDNGKVIGFAMTKDTTPELPSLDSPMLTDPLTLPKQDDPSGLGIQAPGPDAVVESQESVYRPSQPPAAVSPQPPTRPENDDIYFDDGLADELDFEHDGAVFDESIFDNNDTDQYGRPIPGAFAQAKEAMQMAHRQQQHHSKRDSDMTSSASGQSGVVGSTPQTSLDVGPQQPAGHQEVEDSSTQPAAGPGMAVVNEESGHADQDLAYQAALAEATQIAAASGKFRRSSSPDVLAGLADAPPVDADEPGYSETNGYIDDYADDAFGNDFDDFDFDDEAIIAEANASALANDSDGFYGHEFGFYSAPVSHQPPHSSHSNQPSTTASSATPSSAGVLTTENLFQYANGGYFGPASAGLDRSASARVGREPNLTPITERSEYSNRNSIMSFTLPPAIGGSEGRNSAALTSPGLAQLALLADDGDNMSLSALMKLRSKAWGGSQASRGSSREGSPRSERAALPAAPLLAPGMEGGSGSPYGTVPAHLAGHVRVNSGLSLWSCSEATEEEAVEGFPPPPPLSREGRGSGSASPAGAAAMTMASLAGSGFGAVVLPPRPGSAGAVVHGGGSASANGLVVSPLPQRPHSLFLPPVQPPIQGSSPGSQQVGGGSACSPVLEGEEADAETAAAAEGFALAPALPLRPRSSVEVGEGRGREAVVSQAQRPGMIGHRHKGSADSISYMKDEDAGGSKWVVERRRTAESGEVEILGREVVAGGMI